MAQSPNRDPAELTFWERYKRPIFIAALFVVIFISARLTIRPINNIDYGVHVRALQALRMGQNPYDVGGYFLPPWDGLLLAPLAYEPLETWLSLGVALLVAATLDIGSPSGLLLLLHPVFVTLIASSNPEWLFVGSGLWLLYRAPRGWGRGLAWLLLTGKPQTTAIMLAFDGLDALRQRDWKAIGLSAVVALGSVALYPQVFRAFTTAVGSTRTTWSPTVVSNWGILAAILVTMLIVAIRWHRREDRKTLGLLLAPVWSPYMVQYNYMATIFTMRRAGWLRNIVYLAASIGLAALFWRDYHVAEQIGVLGMVLLAAIMAPAQPQAMPEGESSKQMDQPALQSAA